MEHNLFLRPTEIGGKREQGDYTVWRRDETGERPIGRIRNTFHHVWTVSRWNWHITVPLPMGSWGRGSAESLEAATAVFRAAWERFYADLSPEQIARWYRTQDARKP